MHVFAKSAPARMCPNIGASQTNELQRFLCSLEEHKDGLWKRFDHCVNLKLHWRALAARHSLHIIPGQTILEFGAGSGAWTRQISSILHGENPITAAVFNPKYLELVPQLTNTTFVHVQQPHSDLPLATFDYILGSMMLGHPQFPEVLSALHKLLKPGGQILFFEENFNNPGVYLRRLCSALPRKIRSFSISSNGILQACSASGFKDARFTPYDFIPSRLPGSLILNMQSKVILFEHFPGVRSLCGSMCLTAKDPGDRTVKALPDLAVHSGLLGKVSVVIPCHNEASNVPRITEKLLALYGPYIREILIVNDNSTDETAEVTRRLADADSRIVLLDRPKPNGVGRALRDGYAAASGDYILSMDSDFIEILPELRDLFDTVAAGADGAIGSRFSHESILLNYPFLKMLCNRVFHALIKLFLLPNCRDITNNLKLYRADILKQLPIESPHFSANLETGLIPLLNGYNIREVPISWIDRTEGMGTSSFNVRRVGSDYLRVLLRVWKTQRPPRSRALRHFVSTLCWVTGGIGSLRSAEE